MGWVRWNRIGMDGWMDGWIQALRHGMGLEGFSFCCSDMAAACSTLTFLLLVQHRDPVAVVDRPKEAGGQLNFGRGGQGPALWRLGCVHGRGR